MTEITTPLYYAYGGVLYKINIEVDGSAVDVGGQNLNEAIMLIKKQLAGNTTTYFTDSDDKLEALSPLTPGDHCLVTRADGTASMYIWLPANRWLKLYDVQGG